MTWIRTAEDIKRHGNQKLIVLQHLQSGASLSQAEALETYGIRRLASRISELRKEGYAFKVERGSDDCAIYTLIEAVEAPKPKPFIGSQGRLFDLTPLEKIQLADAGGRRR